MIKPAIAIPPIPVLPYGIDAFTVMSWDQNTLQAAEICYLRAVKGHTGLDDLKDGDIRKELRVESIMQNIIHHRAVLMNW
jgi:hypothetical protein